MDQRIIFHIDMDAFFASIEVVENPSLRGKAVIVGGDPSKRGVVSTCSYEARKYGVRSAMPLSEAKKRCPHGVFVHGNFSKYREYSEKIMEIFLSFTPTVQIVSIDEAYLDISEIVSTFEQAKLLAHSIHRSVFDATFLTCSIGIGVNKLIAKIASSQNKPNGLTVVYPGEEGSFLAPLPIQALPGVGEKTQQHFNGDGIFYVRDLQQMDLDTLFEKYGARGHSLFYEVRGIDTRPVDVEDSAPKSIGAETTFEKDISELNLLLATLQELVEKVWKRLLRNGMRARGISIKFRFSNFTTITRSQILFTHTQSFEVLLDEFITLFKAFYPADTPLRLVGATLERLTDTEWQPTLWNWEQEPL